MMPKIQHCSLPLHNQPPSQEHLEESRVLMFENFLGDPVHASFCVVAPAYLPIHILSRAPRFNGWPRLSPSLHRPSYPATHSPPRIQGRLLYRPGRQLTAGDDIQPTSGAVSGR